MIDADDEILSINLDEGSLHIRFADIRAISVSRVTYEQSLIKIICEKRDHDLSVWCKVKEAQSKAHRICDAWKEYIQKHPKSKEEPKAPENESSIDPILSLG